MQECIFTDEYGEQLIVRHRKSAIFLLREIDLDIAGHVSPFWTDKTPRVRADEIERRYAFSTKELLNLTEYLTQAAHESWTNFSPKEATSMGADYNEYYDSEFDNNGYLSLGENYLRLEGPSQPKTDDPIIRMYKFNKRKMESFLFELHQLSTTVALAN